MVSLNGLDTFQDGGVYIVFALWRDGLNEFIFTEIVLPAVIFFGVSEEGLAHELGELRLLAGAQEDFADLLFDRRHVGEVVNSSGALLEDQLAVKQFADRRRESEKSTEVGEVRRPAANRAGASK